MMHKFRTAAPYLLAVVLGVGASIAPAFAQSEPQAGQGSPANAASGDEVSLLKQQLAAQEKQLEQMQATLAQMKARLDHAEQVSKVSGATQAASTAPAGSTGLAKPATLGQVASLIPLIPKASPGSAPSPPVTSSTGTSTPSFYNNGASPADEQGLSPLSVKIGGAEFTPGGFLDFTAFGRSTNLGSGIGTSFGSLPFSHTTAGSLSETRFTMQNSRVSLDVNSKFQGFDLHGHIEADFLGFAPPNLFVTSNSNTMRSRLYWLDARKGKFEFLGGQSWSMLTPNRTGLSPNPSDIFYSQDMDTNYQLGLTWARQAQFRLIYHPTDTVAWGVSIEDPQQLYGNATVPSSLVAEGDNGSGSITNSNAANNPATPNVAPDIITKLAFDPKIGDLHEHIEFAGLLTSTRVFDPKANFRSTAEGAGVSANFNFELVKNLHAIANTFYSDGGGRYVFGLAPNFIIDRNANGAYHPSLVHADSAVAGLEYQVNKYTMFYGYWGGLYVKRNFGIDCFTQPTPPSTGGTGTDNDTTPTPVCNSTPSNSPSYIGYGYPGSSNSQNKNIQEGTFGIIETFWKNPHYGALQLITQYSYLNREPWVVATGNPKDAHLSMGYVDLRYVLP
jgi:hypothetical protein